MNTKRDASLAVDRKMNSVSVLDERQSSDSASYDDDTSDTSYDRSIDRSHSSSDTSLSDYDDKAQVEMHLDACSSGVSTLNNIEPDD